MNELDLHYPPDACPFCGIASAFPAPLASPVSERDLAACIPSEEKSNIEKTTPSSFVILASRDVMAFLDILPMTTGHLLVATRGHRVKVADMEAEEGREMGKSAK